jgi:hypothetical protein
MNKKITIISILAVLMLIAIALSATVSSNATNTDKKESPLWRIRTKREINEKLENIINNIKASFIGEGRAFFIPQVIRFLQREELRLGSVVVTVPMYCMCKF